MKLNISVPNSLNEITLEQYQAFVKESDKKLSQEMLSQKMIEIFCNLRLPEVAKIKYSSLNQITTKLNSLFEKKPTFIQRFKMKGVEYGFHPKLEDMSLGEYIDLDNTFTNWDTMHQAMAVLYRPIEQRLGHKYLIQDYEGYSKSDMRDMPINVVLGCMVFFWNLRKGLLKATLNYLEREEMNLTSQQRQILQKSGISMGVFTNWLKGMSEDLIPSQDWDYISA